jgi:hypothetical protein
VIVHRGGKRHQHGRQGRGGELRHGQRAGAADEQLRPAVGLGHVIDERLDPRLHACLAIGALGHLEGGPTGLVAHLEDLPGPEQRQRARHGLVERARALAAAKHQQAQRGAIAVTLVGRGQPEQRLAHGIADHAYTDTRWEGTFEGAEHLVGDARQPAVGQAGHGILLVDDQRAPARAMPRSRRARRRTRPCPARRAGAAGGECGAPGAVHAAA